MIEAEAGLMYITGEENGTPVKVGVAVTGIGGGKKAFHGKIPCFWTKLNTMFILTDIMYTYKFSSASRSDNRTLRPWRHHGRFARPIPHRPRPAH